MSRENVETVRAFVAALNERGPVEAAALLPREIEFDWSASVGPYAGRYHGRDAVSRWLEKICEAWAEIRFDPREFIDVDDECVVLVNRVRVRGRGSGVEVVGEGAQVWTFENGSPVCVRIYQSKEDALDALGRRP